MSGRFWRYAPLALLLMALVVWFERFLPASDLLGPEALQRCVLGVACVILAVVVVTVQHLEGLFRQVLGQFKQFHEQQQPGRAKPDGAAADEAVRILVAALDSDQADVRASAAENLERLTGRQLGADAEAWRAYLRDSPPPGAGSGPEG